MALSKQYNIKWRKQDYLSLGKAVADFNKKINKLNSEEVKSYLPSTLNYKEVKENITTRNELKRVLASLKRFSIKGAEDLYITKAGEQLTKWERGELERQIKVAKGRLTLELSELNIPNIQGYSKAQMGSEQVQKIKDTLNSLNKLEYKKGYEFDKLVRRIENLGASDYNLKKARTFQETVMKELDNLRQEIPEFNKIYNHFNNIKNPITFYNNYQKSDVMSNFFTWYKNPKNFADFKTDEEIADYIIEQYEDISVDEEFEDNTIFELKGNKRGRRRYGLFVNCSIETSSNNLSKIYDLFREYQDRGNNLNIVDIKNNKVLE